MDRQYLFAEFFCGGGMARAGLGSKWECILANDIDEKKCSSYKMNWSSDHLFEGDVANLPTEKLLRDVDLYWASSPCQDFSLAGKRNGLLGDKSSTFFPWINKVREVVNQGYPPKIIAFENVVGLLSANNGQDFAQVVAEISSLGYHIGAVILDAKHFVPHSRPRLFVIAVHEKCLNLFSNINVTLRHLDAPVQLQRAHSNLSDELQKKWIWWPLELPLKSRVELSDIIDTDLPDELWMTEMETGKLVELMSPLHKEKLLAASKVGTQIVGTIYKRGRPDETGKIVQRAELRLDGLAGCLRTPGGGSSRQTVIVIKGSEIRARLLTSREAARLMGLPDTYNMPKRYNDAYHLAGDGVVVPVVEFLTKTIFEPLLNSTTLEKVA